MRKFYDIYLDGYGGGGWQPIFGEWQLCPKCGGEGIIHGATHNYGSTQVTMNPTCDVCGGAKVLQRPIINQTKTE